MSIFPKRRVKDPSTAEERERTTRNAQLIGSLLALAGSTIVGPSAFAGHSIRSILRSARLAPGRVGNIKLADTVGQRMKQAQAIDPKLAKAGWARFGQPGFFKNLPVYNKKVGNPLAFKFSMIKSLKKIKGDRGAKKLIRLNKSKVKFVKIKSKSILIDFDQLKDFPSTT